MSRLFLLSMNTVRFKYHYSWIHSVTANCSYNIAQPSGYITSPNYPSAYDPYTNCSWSLDVMNNTAVIKLFSFYLNPSINCSLDYIQVRSLCNLLTAKALECNALPLLINIII